MRSPTAVYFRFIVFFVTVMFTGVIWPLSAQSGPILSTQVPTSSSVGSMFFVFSPITNTGTRTATE